MIVLDTDHLTVYSYEHDSRYRRLTERMLTSPDSDFRTTIVNVEEQARGRLAEIKQFAQVRDQIRAYDRLQMLFDFLRRFRILPFDIAAAEEFERHRKQKIRVGSMDLKIASIARVNDALLLSANLRDYRQVPGLKLENWLED